MLLPIKKYILKRISQKVLKIKPLNGRLPDLSLCANEEFNYLNLKCPSRVTSIYERVTLFNLSSLTKGDVIEIGSGIGGSSICLAAGLMPGTKRRLHTIDIFEGEKGSKTTTAPDIYKEHSQYDLFKIQIKSANVEERIKIYRGSSRDYFSELGKLKDVELIFIDGSHLYEDAKFDIENYHKILQPGGYYVIHDYNLPLDNKWAGVRKATDDFLKNNPSFRAKYVLDSMLVIQKQ
ncbi:class I SAM-dependent methyltransferase [Akkermansiaceae bacterium]|nr:class I SAM-dependent methyltransferase [Akkermansiaceae bacterium]